MRMETPTVGEYSIREFSEAALLGDDCITWESLDPIRRAQKPQGAEKYMDKGVTWETLADHDKALIFQYVLQTDKLRLLDEQCQVEEELQKDTPI